MIVLGNWLYLRLCVAQNLLGLLDNALIVSTLQLFRCSIVLDVNCQIDDCCVFLSLSLRLLSMLDHLTYWRHLLSRIHCLVLIKVGNQLTALTVLNR